MVDLSQAKVREIIENDVDPDIPFQESIVGADIAAEKIVEHMSQGDGEEKRYFRHLTEDMVDMLYASKKSTIIELVSEIIDEAQGCPVNDQSKCSWLGDTRMENMIWGLMSQGEVDILNSGWGDDDEI